MPFAGTPLRVIAPVLDLASSPGGGVVSQVPCGDELRPVGGPRGDFVEVIAPWGTGPAEVERGWCLSEGLVPVAGLVSPAGPVPPAGPGTAEEGEPTHWVHSSEALAFSQPTRRAGAPVERLPLGAALRAAPVGDEDSADLAAQEKSADRRPRGFVCVTVRGKPVWVQAEDLGAAPPRAETPDQRVALAGRLLGRPYVWGGCTSLGLDCSGLVVLLARLAGVGLPHSAAAQAKFQNDRFAAVDPDATAPGDFLYLADAHGRVDHVVVAAGEGTVLHASAEAGPPAVRREPWETVKKRGPLAAARRLVDDPGEES